MSKFIFLTLIGFTASTAAAQRNSTSGSPATANGAFERIVTGVPFFADSITVVVQTAVDGSHVKSTTTAVIARDSHGRTRYSQNLSLLLPGGPHVLTFIRDPIAGIRYSMDSREAVARREALPTRSLVPGDTAGVQLWSPQDAAIKIARQSVKSMLSARNAALSQSLHSEATPLGDQLVDGIPASGARVSAVVPAGQIGNDKPLTFSSEAWYSPELSIIVMSRVSDPVTGDTNVQITKLRRGEPNPDLFVVPPGYRIVGPAISSEPGPQRVKD